MAKRRLVWGWVVVFLGLACAGEGAAPPVKATECLPGEGGCWERVAQRCDASGTWVNLELCPFSCEGGVCTGACAPGERRCAGLQVERCEEGAWVPEGEGCPFGCEAGACAGGCVEGAKRCWEGVAQSCEAGAWKNVESCPFVCEEGRCVGSCVPGEERCAEGRVQRCEAGDWVDAEDCRYACEAGRCVGECVEGDKRCLGNVLQACDASGAWMTSEVCPFLCTEESCAGECEPGSSSCEGSLLLYCDASAAWSPVLSCPAGCDAGACLAECNPGERRCLGDWVQRCGETGLWTASELCPAGCDEGQCLKTCAPGETRCVENGLEICGDDGHWGEIRPCAFGCEADACRSCMPGMTRCADGQIQTCDAQGNWASPLSCEDGMECREGICQERLPPSCAPGGPGLSDCGASGAENCCESLLVPGGSFFQDNDPRYSATISTFRLDRFEVTVGRFRQFVDATKAGWSPSPGQGKHLHLNGGAGLIEREGHAFEAGWDPAWNLPTDWSQAFAEEGGGLCNWTDQPGPNENLAINCIRWHEAYAFCIWDGGFLPSEAEWNYAAAGGDDQRFFPWGEDDPLTGNFSYHAGNCTGGCMGPGLVGVHPAGAARWGHEDMAGNAAEWVLDWARPYVGDDCIDCVSMSGTASARGLRGGAHWDHPWLQSTEERSFGASNFRVFGAGVRCARLP